MKKSIIFFIIGYGLLMLAGLIQNAHSADLCDKYARTLMREAQAVNGIGAPSPLYMAQIRQESSCREGVTAYDNGRGLAQFMDGTSKQVSSLYPELGPPDPYNPRWAIRALIRYNGWIYQRVKGKDPCHRWGATLKGYNAGPGYVIKAQTKSPDPLVWFGVTEFVPTQQSPENFEYSRTYPRKILFKHQPIYAALGTTVCSNRGQV
jgi:soluble lytic murein transglycosylase-like protein